MRACITAEDTTSTGPCTADVALETKVLQIDVTRSRRTADETGIAVSADEARCIAAKVANGSAAVEEVDEANPILIHTPAHIHVADGMEAAVEDTLETVIAVCNTSEIRIIREVKVAIQFCVHLHVAGLDKLGKPAYIQLVVQLIESIHDFAEIIADGTAIDTMIIPIYILMRWTNRLNRIVGVRTAFDRRSVTQQFTLQIDLLAGVEGHRICILADGLPIDNLACKSIDIVCNLTAEDILGGISMVNILEGHLVETEVIAVHTDGSIIRVTEHAASVGINTVDRTQVDTVHNTCVGIIAQPTGDTTGLTIAGRCDCASVDTIV